MLFNSVPFIFFFIIVVTLHFALPSRYRWLLLLLASYYFYMCWKAEYAILILLTTTIDFCVAKHIATIKEQVKRRKFVAISLIFNLGILFSFKYFNFLSSSTTAVLSRFNIFIETPVFHALLPVGISFYTFQSLSYVLDVYKNRIEPEKHWGYYALYVSFWPQLVAGPIERPGNLLPQFRQKQVFNADRAASGLRLILLGLFKKVVIADSLAIYVNRVYNHVGDYQTQSLTLIMATVFFTIQIYCDFSGYTDVARGAARVMGYQLMENFRRPYLASSIHDFWRRWHISLSTWFRDYVYIPLGGNRAGFAKWNRNLLVTFLLSGLWHGANWTFVMWGLLHGCFLVIENCAKALKTRFSAIPATSATRVRIKSAQIVITFIFLCLAWIFFRANSLEDAILILHGIFACNFTGSAVEVVGVAPFCRYTLLIVLLLLIDLIQEHERTRAVFTGMPSPLRWSIYTTAVWGILISAVFGVQQQFIYFQF